MRAIILLLLFLACNIMVLKINILFAADVPARSRATTPDDPLIELDSKRINDWLVTSFAKKDNGFDHCAINNLKIGTYDVEFDVFADGKTMLLGSDAWSLPIGENYSVIITGGASPFQIKTRSVSKNAVRLELLPETYDFIKTKDKIVIQAARTSLVVEMNGVGAAMNELDNCYAKYSGQMSNPFKS